MSTHDLLPKRNVGAAVVLYILIVVSFHVLLFKKYSQTYLFYFQNPFYICNTFHTRNNWNSLPAPLVDPLKLWFFYQIHYQVTLWFFYVLPDILMI